MHRLILAMTAVLVAGCGSVWGPLAAARGSGGDQALASGTLVITDRCTFLESGGERTLLVWPAEQTSWNPLTATIIFKPLRGQPIEVRNGQLVSLGGGGSSQAEDGLVGEAWAARFDWASPPAPECLVENRWSVTDVDEVVRWQRPPT